MRHYHGTPFGGARVDLARFVTGRSFLIPFKRPEDLPTVAAGAVGFCFDNSAFTSWKSGEPITNWGDFYKWCKEWSRHPGFEFAIIPDIIDGTERDNDELLREWERRMFAPQRVEGVPVWHMHESLERLYRLVTGHWRRVAIGSSGEWPNPGTPNWWSRMREAMNVATDEDGRPRAKLHGLRMMDPEIFTRLPLASVDSTNVAQNKALPRRYPAPTVSAQAELIATRIEASNSPAVWSPKETQYKLKAAHV